MGSLDEYAKAKLAELERQSLRRALMTTARADGLWVERNGRRLLSFSCNDYLNLTHHPALKEAAIAAIARHGVGAGASRYISGNHPLYTELEAKLARFKDTEDCCVFGSGYLANAGVIPALVGRGDLVLIDELAHASLWTGARLTRGAVVPFRHNDAGHLESLLAAQRARHPRALIVTEGVFSMDGDRAPLDALLRLAQDADAWLLVDDAHAIGVLNGGRGSRLADAANVLHMGTLSKAIGAYGAYLCASRPVIDMIRNRARTLIYTTGLPPAVLAAASAALDVIAQEPHYVARPLAKAKTFTQLLGLPEAESAIVPIVLGAADAALNAARQLEEEGFLVVAIRPPTVPANTARLRLAFTAAHPDAELERLAGIIRRKILPR